MTADPVRPQETLRARLAQALADVDPAMRFDSPLFTGRRALADCAADAVLPIVEEETKPLIEEIEEFAVELVNERAEHQALRDKVKALVADADSRGGFVGIDGVAIPPLVDANELRALVEEPQGGER